MSTIHLHYVVPGDDFTQAGEASSRVKGKLKQLGFDPNVTRKVTIAMYEAEINMVIHAGGGEVDVTITPEQVEVILSDQGPGIPDVEKAMQEGYSTAPDHVRMLGFGAGMGLPNIKKYADEMFLDTQVGIGTTVRIIVRVQRHSQAS